jgi:hypothetical protein
MDPFHFDALARSFATAGTRRRLLAVLAALPLGGTLLALEDDEVAAEHPRDRMKRRNQQRKRKQRNNKNNNKKNKNKNNNKKNGGLGGSQCGATGSDCSQDSDCCSNNCFNLGCADKVNSCGSGDNAKACHPAANGCAGGTCCYGAAACGDTCCDGTANQCNRQGACCAPNCSGRQCGPDGCGGGGICGACPSGATCNEATGQCGCVRQCAGKNCGSDGCGGSCGTCPSDQGCVGGVCEPVPPIAGTCRPGDDLCTNTTEPSCNGRSTCFCLGSFLGFPACVSDFQCFDCATDQDCRLQGQVDPASGLDPKTAICIQRSGPECPCISLCANPCPAPA